MQYHARASHHSGSPFGGSHDGNRGFLRDQEDPMVEKYQVPRKHRAVGSRVSGSRTFHPKH